MKRAYIILAQGFEEVEAITPIDYLRRAGVDVTVVALDSLQVVSARSLIVTADALLADVLTLNHPDLIVLPGGIKGSRAIAASEPVRRLVSEMAREGKLIAAICASPAVALYPWGLLEGKTWTCYPGEEEALGVRVSESRVVVDGKIITSRGPGTAGEFSLALVEALEGKDVAHQLARGTVTNAHP